MYLHCNLTYTFLFSGVCGDARHLVFCKIGLTDLQKLYELFIKSGSLKLHFLLYLLHKVVINYLTLWRLIYMSKKEFRLVGATGKNCFPVCDVKMMFHDRSEAAAYILKNSFSFSNWSLLRENLALVVDDEGYIVADVDLGLNHIVYHDWNRG